MNTLKMLNLKPGFVYEVLCGTYNPDGSPNLAPMGIRLNKGLILSPYVTSQTYKNLEATRSCSLNFSDDAWIFAWACFEKECVRPHLISGKKVKCPVLHDATAVVECTIEQIVPTPDEARRAAICMPINVEIQEKFVPFTRAFSLFVELLIHATRIAPLEALGDLSKVQELKQDIVTYAKIIQRVAWTEYPALVDYVLKKVGLENASDG